MQKRQKQQLTYGVELMKQVKCCHCNRIVDLINSDESVFICCCSQFATCLDCAKYPCLKCSNHRTTKLDRKIIKNKQRAKQAKLNQSSNNQISKINNKSQYDSNDLLSKSAKLGGIFLKKSSKDNQENAKSSLIKSSSKARCQSCQKYFQCQISSTSYKDSLILCKQCENHNYKFISPNQSKLRSKQSNLSLKKTQSQEKGYKLKNCALCNRQFGKKVYEKDDPNDLCLCSKCTQEQIQAQQKHQSSRIRQKKAQNEYNFLKKSSQNDCDSTYFDEGIYKQYKNSKISIEQRNRHNNEQKKQKKQNVNQMINKSKMQRSDQKRQGYKQMNKQKEVQQYKMSEQYNRLLNKNNNLNESIIRKPKKIIKQGRQFSLISQTLIQKSFEEEYKDIKRKYSIEQIAQEQHIQIRLQQDLINQQFVQDYRSDKVRNRQIVKKKQFEMDIQGQQLVQQQYSKRQNEMRYCMQCRYSMMNKNGYYYNPTDQCIFAIRQLKELKKNTRDNNYMSEQNSWFLCMLCVKQYLQLTNNSNMTNNNNRINNNMINNNNNRMIAQNDRREDSSNEHIMNCGFRIQY